MVVLNNNHQYTIIASLEKIYNYAKINGVLKPKELYLLNIIYKLLNNCDNCYNDQIKLISLYHKILNNSKLLCKSNNVKDYYFSNFNGFYIDVNNNTPPIITDPTPVDPDPVIPPKTCGNAFNVIYPLKVYFFTLEDIARPGCFIDQYGGYIKNIKIKQLPTEGILTYNDINVTVNDIIDLDNISNFKYTSLNNDTDTFSYIIAGSSNPTIFNEQDVVNIILNNG